jgi:hypothetical protein
MTGLRDEVDYKLMFVSKPKFSQDSDNDDARASSEVVPHPSGLLPSDPNAAVCSSSRLSTPEDKSQVSYVMKIHGDQIQDNHEALESPRRRRKNEEEEEHLLDRESSTMSFGVYRISVQDASSPKASVAAGGIKFHFADDNTLTSSFNDTRLADGELGADQVADDSKKEQNLRNSPTAAEPEHSESSSRMQERSPLRRHDSGRDWRSRTSSLSSISGLDSPRILRECLQAQRGLLRQERIAKKERKCIGILGKIRRGYRSSHRC